MIRAFRVAPGRTVTLPQGLRAGAGQTNMRLEEGAVVKLDVSGTAALFSRFVNGRKDAGDWDEIDPATVPDDLDGSGERVSLVGDPHREPQSLGLEMPRPRAPGAVGKGR